jgi:hypothetical protein
MPSSLLTIALLLAAPCLAQDVADPGRRLSEEEIKRLDAQTQGAPRREPVPNLKPSIRARDPVACDHARTNYQIWCGAPASRKSCRRPSKLGRRSKGSALLLLHLLERLQLLRGELVLPRERLLEVRI